MPLDKQAVFLDRDGTINEDVNYLTKPEQLKLFPRVAEAIASLNKDYLVFIVTNQAAVGKGLCTEDEVNKVHDYLLAELWPGRISKVYSCFHHPVYGIGDYLKECSCRKPKSGMILQAASEFNVSLKDSYMIGDKIIDIKAGSSAGVRTILVKTGYAGRDSTIDIVPDYVAEDLYEASRLIMEKK